MDKIKVWNSESQTTDAIKVFDSSSDGVKPSDAILVCSGDNGPTNAIKVSVVDEASDAIKVWFAGSETPASLPDYTIRLKFTDGVTPTFSKGTAVQVSESPNIWDLTYENSDWSELLKNNSDLIEVIEANTEDVVNMSSMFSGCLILTSVALFDTSNVTNMSDMFINCNYLTTIPLFDTSNVTTTNYMFNNCYYVESGALALYQQMSSQTNPPSSHIGTFINCGRETETGAAELAQIPADWGGRGG